MTGIERQTLRKLVTSIADARQECADREIPALRALAVVLGDAPEPEPGLLQPTDLHYLGAFRVPRVPWEPHGKADRTFATGGWAAAVGKDGTLLYLAGNGIQPQVARISIPDLGQGALADLPRAAFDGSALFTDPTAGAFTAIRNACLGGLLVHKGALLWTVYTSYDASEHRTVLSHGVDNRGPFRLISPQAGYVAGYLAHAPGGMVVCGQSGIPIIGRTSTGPAAFLFNPDDLGRVDPVPCQPLVYYPFGPNAWSENPHEVAYVRGAIVTERELVLIGWRPVGHSWYDEASNPGQRPDPCSRAQGIHSEGREPVAWFYEMAKLGGPEPWKHRPYAVRVLHDHPLLRHECARVESAAYDPERKRLYAVQFGGELDGYDYLPVVHVYSVEQPGSGEPVL